jgi:hypothetical protein
MTETHIKPGINGAGFSFACMPPVQAVKALTWGQTSVDFVLTGVAKG